MLVPCTARTRANTVDGGRELPLRLVIHGGIPFLPPAPAAVHRSGSPTAAWPACDAGAAGDCARSGGAWGIAGGSSSSILPRRLLPGGEGPRNVRLGKRCGFVA